MILRMLEGFQQRLFLTRIAWYEHIGVDILRIKSKTSIAHKNRHLGGDMSENRQIYVFLPIFGWL